MDIKTAPHRSLRFETINEALAELDRVEAAHRDGRLKATGNWTVGQNLAHIAAWIEYGWTGFLVKSPPWFVRWILRMRMKSMLRGKMPRGVMIPGVNGGTTGADEMEVPAAIDRLRKAFQRLSTGEPAKFESPAFGKMSETDRVQLNLRHAELHLGYVSY